MENDIIKIEGYDGQIQNYTDDVFAAVSKVGDYFARLQLMTANSDECKSGDFKINNYALVEGKNLLDLGPSVDCLCIAFRPKAIDMSGDQVLCVYDPKLVEGVATGEFARIATKSELPNSNCMFGPEYLVYIPSVKKFATFFMGSKTARNESPAMKQRLQQAVTLQSKKCQNKTYTWYGPLVKPCTTPFDLPGAKPFKQALEKFNNPPESEVEKVEVPDTNRAR